MAFFNNLFGSKSAATPSASSGDFADFANPSATDLATSASHTLASGSVPSSTASASAVPYTKWYNVHERYSWKDFQGEAVILGLMLVVLAVHVVGALRNRRKARAWMQAHQTLLAREFAQVGFGRLPHAALLAATDPAEKTKLLAAQEAKFAKADPKTLLKEHSLFEFSTYASGRQNVAFVDARLKLVKRFNPFVILAENILGFFIDSLQSPVDAVEAALYPFDGKEALTIPGYAEMLAAESAAAANGGSGSGKAASTPKSTYDGFVWAIVNKDRMKEVREDRFDVSLTFTKDNAKLPPWLTVMSESGEITNALLTDELVAAAKSAGDLLDYLIISDQPADKPTTIEETAGRKRVFLKYRLPADDDYTGLLPIFAYFLKVGDVLVQSAKLRPEVLRKIKATRDDTVKQIQKASEEEKAEERAVERERLRKQKRDAELNALDAKAQKKYLQREREREMRRATKRSTMRA